MNILIDKLRIVTKVLFPYRNVALILMLFFALSLVYSFVFQSPTHQDSIALPLFLGILWLLNCYLLLVFLQRSSVQAALESTNKLNIVKRLYNFFQRGFYYFIGLLFFGLTLAISILTFRILTVWL